MSGSAGAEESSSPGSTHWFEALAEHLGPAYLRYSFTKGTDQEAAFLVDVLGLRPGQLLLDVGCGPGRHAHALARRGLRVVGVDVSAEFMALAAGAAPPGAAFLRGDARRLPLTGDFDAVVSLCQGGFGLPANEGDDGAVLDGMARILRPGGRLALTAFSSYFLVRHLEDGDAFDAASGINHERTSVRSEAGEEREFDLWTSCFTPRELRLLASAAGLEVDAIWSAGPGDYARRPPDIDHPEFLLIATKPGQSSTAR